MWSIVCFYVPRALRGQGLVHALIAAACRHAKARGAKVVEAYPVDEVVGRAGSRRHVMRERLR